jgi:hypothetical protein
MQLSFTNLPLLSLLALMSTSAALANPTPEAFTLEARDVCGAGYEAYTRRIGSPCAASNGVHEFCSCDRTNIVSSDRLAVPFICFVMLPHRSSRECVQLDRSIH